MSGLVARVARDFPRELPGGRALEPPEIEPGLTFLIDPFEFEVALRNLLKNALEAAASGTDTPKVRLTLKRLNDALVLTVEKNGPVVTDDVSARLSRPLASGKSGGLGLGLPIVRTIAERYQGSLVFTRLVSGGMRAEMIVRAEPA